MKKRLIILLFLIVVLVGAGLFGLYYWDHHKNKTSKKKDVATKLVESSKKQQDSQAISTRYVVVMGGKPDSQFVVAEKGAKLVWQNLDAKSYTLKFTGSPAMQDIKLSPHSDIEQVVNQKGTYTYKSVEKPELTGTIEVY